MKQYDQLADRMLEAIKKYHDAIEYSKTAEEKYMPLAARSCASIAQEEIDKARKERDEKLKKIRELVDKFVWKQEAPGETIKKIKEIL